MEEMGMTNEQYKGMLLDELEMTGRKFENWLWKQITKRF